jgi:hypothetical protein
LRTYKAGAVPEDPSELTGFLRRELNSLQQAAQRADDYFALKVLHAEPARTFEGMVVLADGVDWEPLGAGGGLFVYFGATWVKCSN